MNLAKLTNLVEQLPTHLQEEVLDFTYSLVESQKSESSRYLSLNWAGGLSEFANKYTALQLQAKALDWWDS